MAVTVTGVPWSYVPPPLTVPPAFGLADTVTVYLFNVVNVVEATLLSQLPLTAFTWKVYEVPTLRPVRLTDVLLVLVHVLPPLMLYFQLLAPLAFHDTVAVALVMLLTVRFVGSAGETRPSVMTTLALLLQPVVLFVAVKV